MPYDQKQRCMVGSHDREPISKRHEARMRHFQKRLLKKATPAERAYYKLCEKIVRACGSRFAKQRTFHLGDTISFVVDAYFQKFKLGVEIDGGRHYRPRDQERDAWRTRVLTEYEGVSIVRFSNKAVLERPAEVLKETVGALLSQESATPSHRRALKKAWAAAVFPEHPTARALPYFP